MQKTRKILFEALVELIVEKGYEKVTIQDIIDTANVGRSTFYSHYENKEQLLFSGDDHFNDLLLTDLFQEKGKFRPEEKLKLVYEHVASHYSVTSAMLGGKDATPMLEHAHGIMKLIVESCVPASEKSREELQMQQFMVESATSALVRLLTCWIDAKMPFSAETMAKKSAETLLAFFSSKEAGLS